MPAAITDLLVKQGDGTQPIPTQLTAEKAVGASTASLAAATGWDTTTAKHVRMYKTTVVSGQTIPDQSTISFYKATLSGTTLSNLTLIWSATGTDQKYDAGDTVDLALTSGWVDDLIEALLTEHNQDGTHGDITTDTIAEKTAGAGVTIDGLTIKDNLVVGGAGKGVATSSLNTTQGQMGGEWATSTPISSGFSAITNNVGRYLQVGKTMHLYLYASGTSNTGYIGLTLPSAPKSNGYWLTKVMDNGVNLDQPGMLELTAGSTAAVAYLKPTGGTFTSSGTKTLHPMTIVYEVA